MREIVAKRYAKALMEIGREEGKYELYGEELQALSRLLSSVPELKEVLANPMFKRDQKKEAIKTLRDKMGLSPMVTNFLMLLVDKRRVEYLDDIAVCYEKMVEEASGRVRATVFSAFPLSQQSIEALRERLSEMTGKDVVISVEEDPSLIAGVVTRIGDMVYDGSLRTQLNNIKETLLKG
jgi:F-type H+-transporting ATPase subunit delta